MLGLAFCCTMAGQTVSGNINGKTADGNYGGASAWNEAGTGTGSFDYDIRALRNELVPDFTYDYGNHIQYLPGVAVWGLKACGVPGRSSWGGMAVAHAGGAVASVIFDHVPKWVIDRMRPDGSRANSFPSGHSTTAFLTATWLQKEYGGKYPWLSGIGYAVATMTAQQRILRNKHWCTDTMAGAVLGVVAAELGYWASDLVLGDHSYRIFDEFSYDSSLKYWDVSYWYSRRLALDGRHGAAANLQVQAPLGARWGLAVRTVAGGISSSRTDDDCTAVLSLLGGAYYLRQVAPKAEIGAHVLAGAGWWDDCNGGSWRATETGTDDGGSWRATGLGGDFVAGLSAAYVLTQSCKVRVIAEWEGLPAAGWLACVNLGIGGSIYF